MSTSSLSLLFCSAVAVVAEYVVVVAANIVVGAVAVETLVAAGGVVLVQVEVVGVIFLVD